MDDHPVVRDGLRAIINEEPDLHVCGEAAGPGAAIATILSTLPDLVLVDLSLSGGSGMELLKDMAIRHPSLPALVVSMHDEAIYAERVLRAGARGYLTKAETSQSLLKAIRQVLDGKVYVSEVVMSSIVSKMGKQRQTTPPIEQLSDRELQVFELMGTGLSTADIAERMHVSIKSVQKYIERAKEKFGASTLKDLLREAFRWQDQQPTVDDD
ncbi:MAG: response regulator transcription factor [Verrucomicrobiota bacterium]|nr:response regulator transcription factor [Verrucomicrobiota bacterium]